MKRFFGNFGIAILLAASLAACGGGSGDSNSGGGTAQAIAAQGVYFGSYTIKGTSTPVSVVGAIVKNGYAYFGDGAGALYVLPSGIKSGSFSGKLTAYAPIGEVFPNGQKITTFKLSGKAVDDGSMVTTVQGNFSGADESGSFNLSWQSVSGDSPSLDSLAGIWQGYYWGSGSTSVVLTVNADGSFSGSDGYGCTITGHISLVSGSDLVKTAATSSRNSTCVGKVSGLGFADTEDLSGLFGGASGTYLYVGLSNSNYGFVAELFK